MPREGHPNYATVVVRSSPLSVAASGSDSPLPQSPYSSKHEGKGRLPASARAYPRASTSPLAAALLLLLLLCGCFAGIYYLITGDQWRLNTVASSMRLVNKHQPDPVRNKVAIIITVHGALEWHVGCLRTLAEHTSGVHLFIADDSGNRTETAQLNLMLQNTPLPSTHIWLGDVPLGYTKAVNAGLRRAHALGFEVMVCLNSDTEVTPNWLEPMVAMLRSDPHIGMVGPISNAASFQSVPDVLAADGSFSANPLPPGWTPNMLARLVFLLAEGKGIELPILNGFVMGIKKEVFDTVGFMDEVLFPFGFGEENDFALRTGQAGFKRLAVPWVYVFHHKTKSYSSKERERLVAESYQALQSKYTDVLRGAVDALRSSPGMESMRSRVKFHLAHTLPTMRAEFSALFVLNVMLDATQPFMLHGGWISLVQEALGLFQNGIHARIAVQMWTLPHFAAAFPDANARGIFWGFAAQSDVDVAKEIIKSGQVYDFLVATHYSTVVTVREVCQHYPHIVPAYYVQDIETKFTADPKEIKIVESTYVTMQRGFMFVKTHWLQQSLKEQFGANAHLIPPTVDSNLFTADPNKHGPATPLHVCSMVRVETPRRNPLQTLQVLSSAVRELGAQRIRATVFGSTIETVREFLKSQNESPDLLNDVNSIGVIGRSNLAELNRQCDVFLDFSAWQAFGRSGLEAMASGCIPILPKSGGATEYAKHGINAFLIDTAAVANGVAILRDIAAQKHDLAKMRQAALETAKQYSIERSSAATTHIFRSFLAAWRQQKTISKLGHENAEHGEFRTLDHAEAAAAASGA